MFLKSLSQGMWVSRNQSYCFICSFTPAFLDFVSQWIKMQEVREDLSIDDSIMTCIAFAEMDARTVHFSRIKIKMSLFAPER